MVIAQVWDDLCNTDIESAQIPESERNLNGLRQLLLAYYEIWSYPKNRRIIQLHFFPIGEKNTYGKNLWKWVGRVAELLPLKIRWLERFEDPNAEKFIVSIDGVDFRKNENRKHPTEPMDRQEMSHKFKHAAYKWEVAVALYSNHIVWVNGPFKGGENDLTILRNGQPDGSGNILDLIPEGKWAMTDRGYRTDVPEEMSKIGYKRDDDPVQLKRYKGRGTSRGETINARIKEFESMSKTFRHGDAEHTAAFKAVVVTVQYHLDMGVKTLFDM